MPDEPTFRFSDRKDRVGQASIALMTCAVVVYLVAANVHGWQRYVVLAVAVVPTTWAMRRAFRVAITWSAERVEVKNYWRSFTFEWRDVERITVALLVSGVVPQTVISFVLKDGRVVRAQATATKKAKRTLLFDKLEEVAPASVRIDRG
jgi:hypothetical protein